MLITGWNHLRSVSPATQKASDRGDELWIHVMRLEFTAKEVVVVQGVNRFAKVVTHSSTTR